MSGRSEDEREMDQIAGGIGSENGEALYSSGYLASEGVAVQ